VISGFGSGAIAIAVIALACLLLFAAGSAGGGRGPGRAAKPGVFFTMLAVAFVAGLIALVLGLL
jgi:hypothetical protein